MNQTQTIFSDRTIARIAHYINIIQATNSQDSGIMAFAYGDIVSVEAALREDGLSEYQIGLIAKAAR
jgi:hypothetical protein